MIDHLGLNVKDYEKSKAFYLAALGPLGYELIMEMTREQIPELPSPKICGLGEGGKPDFWLAQIDPPHTSQHLAFRAKNRAAVDAFYRAAIAAGARDNGPPGIREVYHPNYYGAFVIDLDGHNLEAVCHDPA